MKFQEWLCLAAIITSVSALYLTQHPINADITTKHDDVKSNQQILQDLAQLNASLAGVKNQIEFLRAENQQVLDKIWSIQSKQVAAEHRLAEFMPTAQGYSRISTDLGDVLVSLKNTEKFGDGYKLTFEIGNPMSLTISGLKGKISWGPSIDAEKYNSDSKYKQEIDKNTKIKDFEVLNQLFPGAWNEVKVAVGPAKEDQIGRILVGSFITDKIYMRKVSSP